MLAGWAFEGRHPLRAGPSTIALPDDRSAVDVLRLHRFDHDADRWATTDIVFDLSD